MKSIGNTIKVSLIDPLNTDTNSAGDRFPTSGTYQLNRYRLRGKESNGLA